MGGPDDPNAKQHDQDAAVHSLDALDGACTRGARSVAALDDTLAKLAAPRTSVVIVESEPIVAIAMRRMLAPAYDTHGVRTAEALLAHVEAGHPIDVIVYDCATLDLRPSDLPRRLAASPLPHLAERVVFVATGPLPGDDELYALPGVELLLKPFGSQVLEAAVERRLGSPRR